MKEYNAKKAALIISFIILISMSPGCSNMMERYAIDPSKYTVSVTPVSGLTVTEDGDQAYFSIKLDIQPVADVTINLTSSNTSEGTVSPASLIFTMHNWDTPQTAVITGQNDDASDGSQSFTIVTSPVHSKDSVYHGVNPPDVSVTNSDDETAGITVNPAAGLTTSETGGQATFTVRLNSEPAGDVTIGLTSSNIAEGTVNPEGLIFTSLNWNTAQTVTVTGQDDEVQDGDQTYSIITSAAAASSDTDYNGMDVPDVSVTNSDDDTANIAVTPVAGLTTSETGGQATFTVRLNSEPAGDVTIGLTSSDTAEGTVNPASLTFTSLNWSSPQTVTITGQDDDVRDGDQVYSIITAAVSLDTNYNGMDAPDVSVTNIDNSEFRVNTYTADNQWLPSAAMDSSGNFVVTWDSVGQDGSGWGVYGQRYSSDGTPLGSEFQVNTYTTSDQRDPSAAMDSNGNFVVTWMSRGQDGSSTGIYGQRYSSDGTPLGSEFQVNTYTTSYQRNPSAAMDASGNFVVTWTSYIQDGNGEGIYGQRFSADGTPQGSEFRVNTYTANYQSYPSAAMDASGNFVVAWTSDGQDGSSYGVYGQRYSSDGTPLGSEFRVNTYTVNSQIFSSVAMDSSGNFVVVWQSWGQDGSNYGVYAQRYSSDGTPLGSEFRVNTYTVNDQRHPSAAMDASGNFVVTWTSYGQDGSSTGIYGQRYSSNGTPQGSEFQVNTYTANYQFSPSAAMDASGNFVVTWISNDQDGSGDGIYALDFEW